MEMASPGNRHCANCIGTRLLPIRHDGAVRRCAGEHIISSVHRQQLSAVVYRRLLKTRPFAGPSARQCLYWRHARAAAAAARLNDHTSCITEYGHQCSTPHAARCPITTHWTFAPSPPPPPDQLTKSRHSGDFQKTPKDFLFKCLDN